MKNTQLILLALSCFSTGIKADNLIDRTDQIVVANYDLSGDELWHGYFSPDNLVLVKLSQSHNGEATYINHPTYEEQVGVVHRQVCSLEGVLGELDDIDDIVEPCTDDFPHVHGFGISNFPLHSHLSDYELSTQYANRTCETYGFGAQPEYFGPSAFIDINNAANDSHYFLYNLSQGLSFDCVIPQRD